MTISMIRISLKLKQLEISKFYNLFQKFLENCLLKIWLFAKPMNYYIFCLHLFSSKLYFKKPDKEDLGTYAVAVSDTDGVSSSFVMDEAGKNKTSSFEPYWVGSVSL